MKTKILTVRITEELERLITEYANKHKWTKSFATHEILTKHFYELIGDCD